MADHGWHDVCCREVGREYVEQPSGPLRGRRKIDVSFAVFHERTAFRHVGSRVLIRLCNSGYIVSSLWSCSVSCCVESQVQLCGSGGSRSSRKACPGQWRAVGERVHDGRRGEPDCVRPADVLAVDAGDGQVGAQANVTVHEEHFAA